MSSRNTGPADSEELRAIGIDAPRESALILIVDDSEDMQLLIRSVLGRTGHRLQMASNGAEGLEMARRLRPDLILMDVLMPKMNGYEATREIKNDPFLAATPVVLLTARTETEAKLQGLEEGADDYIAKPFDRRELLARVESLLRISRYRRLLAERNRQIEMELDMARKLQHRLLPASTPEIPGMQIHARYIPMDKVGGDFYDLVPYNDGPEPMLGVLLADVTGHGIPGAFFSAVAKMAFHYNHELREDGPALLDRINDAVMQYSVLGMFLTGLYLCIYPESRRIRYTLAGQCHPLLHRRSTGEIIPLSTKGFPIGIQQGLALEEKSINIESGDRLLVYTDGLTEVNDDLDLFGDEGLKTFLSEHGDRTGPALMDELLAHLRALSGREGFTDDLTALIMDFD